MSNVDNFIYNMQPYAEQASKQLGISRDFILAQWAHESAWGGSDLSKSGYNYGGIKNVGQSYAAGTLYGHARYNSTSDFVKDYIRVMQLDRYKKVRDATTHQGEIMAIGNSGYAEDPAYTSKMAKIVGMVAGKDIPMQEIGWQEKTGVFFSDDWKEPKTYLSVGALGFVLLLWLFK
jgi:flagellum-specific peptidoglycan hydrolase FlgJ